MLFLTLSRRMCKMSTHHVLALLAEKTWFYQKTVWQICFNHVWPPPVNIWILLLLLLWNKNRETLIRGPLAAGAHSPWRPTRRGGYRGQKWSENIFTWILLEHTVCLSRISQWFYFFLHIEEKNFNVFRFGYQYRPLMHYDRWKGKNHFFKNSSDESL